jgi:ABC-2 type transport system permease protein
MSALLAIVAKDLRLLLRDRVALFWTLGFPIVFALLFGTIFRGPDEGAARIAIAFVDEDASVASVSLGRGLVASPSLSVRWSTQEEGERLLRHGAIAALLRVPPGFFQSSNASLELTTDPTRKVEAAHLRSAVVEALVATRGSASSLGLVTRELTVDARSARNGFEVVFPAAILWGLIGCAGSFATAMVAERRSGTFARLRAAPIHDFTILGGKAGSAFVAGLLDALAILAVCHFVLGVRIERPGAVLVVILCCAFCFVGITVFLSVLGRSEQAVGGAGWALLLLLAMIGGAMVPLVAMPAWLRTLGNVSPVKWGIVALEGASWRGLRPMELALPCAILIGVGLASFAAGVVRASRIEA